MVIANLKTSSDAIIQSCESTDDKLIVQKNRIVLSVYSLNQQKIKFKHLNSNSFDIYSSQDENINVDTKVVKNEENGDIMVVVVV